MTSTAPDLAALAARLDRLEAENADLTRRVGDLAARLAGAAPTTAPPAAPTPSAEPARAGGPGPGDTTAPGGDVTMGRRRMLRAGIAAAGAATAGAVVAHAAPAAAANGGPMTLGVVSNSATAATGLAVSGLPSYGFGVTDHGYSGTAYGGAFFAYAKNTAFNDAVRVIAENGAWGVNAIASGVAVSGRSSNAYGITATSTNPTEAGLRASGAGGGAVFVGLRYHVALTNSDVRPAPTADTVPHFQGQIVLDSTATLWLCVADGTPGTWRKLGGGPTAGAFHALAAPARVYDSRPGTAPTSVGPKTRWAANETRTFDLKANGSGVPAGATAAFVTLLLTGASAANGNLTIWANGVAKPLANTLVWGGSAGRFTATAITALDAQARVRVHASHPTDLVLDVVGYYR